MDIFNRNHPVILLLKMRYCAINGMNPRTMTEREQRDFEFSLLHPSVRRAVEVEDAKKKKV